MTGYPRYFTDDRHVVRFKSPSCQGERMFKDAKTNVPTELPEHEFEEMPWYREVPESRAAEIADLTGSGTSAAANAEIEKLCDRFGAELVFMAALVGLEMIYHEAEKAGYKFREKYVEAVTEINARSQSELNPVMLKAVEQIKE